MHPLDVPRTWGVVRGGWNYSFDLRDVARGGSGCRRDSLGWRLLQRRVVP